MSQVSSYEVKIMGVSGSPQKGATQFSVREALEAAAEIPGVSVDFIDLKGKKINFCIHCNRCVKNGLLYCPTHKDDLTEEIYQRYLQADGFIIGSPVYQMTLTGQLQTFFNRLRPIAALFSKGHWATKVGGAIAVGGTRHGGQETTLAAINNYFLCTGMVNVSGGIFAYNGGAVWSQNRKEEGANDDAVGMGTVRVLGRRVAYVAKLLKAGAECFGQSIDPSLLTGVLPEEDTEERKEKFLGK
ncbi:MAG TPA: flavodoxin family protein [Clostridia bacterium]|nr:flavodoxin family protein [Clostridia bacterium]